MQTKTKTFTSADDTVFSRPDGNTTGRFLLAKDALGYKPHGVYSLHQISVQDLDDDDSNARWGVSVSAPGSNAILEHSATPVAGGAGASDVDTVTIENILAEVIQIDLVGLNADGACSVHIVSRPRGFGN